MFYETTMVVESLTPGDTTECHYLYHRRKGRCYQGEIIAYPASGKTLHHLNFGFSGGLTLRGKESIHFTSS